MNPLRQQMDADMSKLSSQERTHYGHIACKPQP